MIYQVQVDSDTGLEAGSKGSNVRDLQKKKKRGVGNGKQVQGYEIGIWAKFSQLDEGQGVYLLFMLQQRNPEPSTEKVFNIAFVTD